MSSPKENYGTTSSDEEEVRGSHLMNYQEKQGVDDIIGGGGGGGDSDGGVGGIGGGDSGNGDGNGDDYVSEKKVSQIHVGTYGNFVAYCFGVNYILGVGVLSIPYAFQSGGLAVGPLFLLIVTILAIIVMNWIIETMSRADTYFKYIQEEKRQKQFRLSGGSPSGQNVDPSDLYSPMEDEDQSSGNVANDDTVQFYEPNSKERFKVTRRKLELNEICNLFIGKGGKILYEICVSLYLFGGLWSYGSVFAQSAAAYIPLPIRFFIPEQGNTTVPFSSSNHHVFDFSTTITETTESNFQNLVTFFGDLFMFYFHSLAKSIIPASTPSIVNPMAVTATLMTTVAGAQNVSNSVWYTCDVYTNYSIACTADYLIYVFIFGCIVVPLTCLNLTEQKLLQVILALFRFLAIALMIGCVVFAFFADPYSQIADKPTEPLPKGPPYFGPFSIFNISGLYKLIPVCIFSQIVHHSLPGLSQPVKNKKNLTRVWTFVFISTFIFYTFLGITLALYYGHHVYATCSLNFAFFRGGSSFEESIPWWVHPITYTIVLFPAIDVLSAFPLNGITLGNNLHASIFTGTRYMNYRSLQVLFRLLAAIPPLIASLFVRDLGIILSYVGLMGFVITFIFPPILYMVSKFKCDRIFGESKTMYSKPIISWWPATIPVILFAIISILFSLTFNILENIGIV